MKTVDIGIFFNNMFHFFIKGELMMQGGMKQTILEFASMSHVT